jgi:hypothetical protein
MIAVPVLAPLLLCGPAPALQPPVVEPALPALVQCGGGPPPPPPPPPVYDGPGDTTPPGPLPIGPITPGDAAPSPTGPTTPGAGPRGGPAPAPTSGGSPAPGSGPSAPSSPPGGAIATLDGWETWWRFNRAPYLRARQVGAANNAYSPSPDARLDRRPSAELIRSTIVPALLARLDSGEQDTEVVNSTLLALARIGDVGGASLGSSELSKRFAAHLGDRNRGVAENACVSLGVLGHASSVPVLAALLGDTETGRGLAKRRAVPEHLRAFAAYGLGLTGQHADNVDVRRFAVHELMKALDHESARPDVRVAVVIALGMIPAERSDDVVQSLLDIFLERRDDTLVRAHAATSMAWLLDGASDALRAEVTQRLLAAVNERNREPNEVRQSSVMALGRIGDVDEDTHDRRIREALMKASSNGDLHARHYALIALGRIGGRAGDGEGDARAGTADIKQFLFRALAKSRAATKPWVALAIGVLGKEADERLAPTDLAAMRNALSTSKAADASAALRIGVGLCADPAAAAPLLAELEESGRDELAVTSLALGLLGDEQAIPPLHAILRESQHDARALEEATIALTLLGDEDLVPVLLEVAGSCECTYSQTVVAAAMGHTADARVVPTLVAMLGDEEAPGRKRAWAASALGRVADKEVLPWTSRISIDLNYAASPASLTTGDGKGIIDFP